MFHKGQLGGKETGGGTVGNRGNGHEMDTLEMDMKLEKYFQYPIRENKTMTNILGVSVFIKDTLHPFEIDANTMNMEDKGDWMWVGISGAQHQIAVTEIYLLTAGNYQKVKNYNEEALKILDGQISKLCEKGWDIIIMGDFNGHVGQIINRNTDKVDPNNQYCKPAESNNSKNVMML